MGRVMLTFLLLLTSTPTAAIAGEAQEQRAHALYAQGEQAFAAERYQEAYDRFKAGYLLIHSPALLYNMSAALERLGRPHEAAEELRSYLRVVGSTKDRAAIEGRVRALDEAQRLLDAERLKNEPPRLLALPPPPRWTRKQTIITVVSTVAGLVAVGALGVGLGLGLRQDYLDSTLKTQRATP